MNTSLELQNTFANSVQQLAPTYNELTEKDKALVEKIIERLDPRNTLLILEVGSESLKPLDQLAKDVHKISDTMSSLGVDTVIRGFSDLVEDARNIRVSGIFSTIQNYLPSRETPEERKRRERREHAESISKRLRTYSGELNQNVKNLDEAFSVLQKKIIPLARELDDELYRSGHVINLTIIALKEWQKRYRDNPQEFLKNFDTTHTDVPIEESHVTSFNSAIDAQITSQFSARTVASMARTALKIVSDTGMMNAIKIQQILKTDVPLWNVQLAQSAIINANYRSAAAIEDAHATGNMIFKDGIDLLKQSVEMSCEYQKVHGFALETLQDAAKSLQEIAKGYNAHQKNIGAQHIQTREKLKALEGQMNNLREGMETETPSAQRIEQNIPGL